MKFRDPWIDPRVQEIRPTQLLAYLAAKHWSETRAHHPSMRAFRDGHGHGDVLVPKATAYDRYVQDIIDAVTLLAKAEDRYAGEVLTDLLGQSGTDAGVNATAPAGVDKPGMMPQPTNH